jgi:UDP-glucose 4-epimerase
VGEARDALSDPHTVPGMTTTQDLTAETTTPALYNVDGVAGRRVVVTGGAGYIGSVVTRKLLESGASVVVLDNFSTGHRCAVPSGAEIVEADLREPGSACRALEGSEIVMHFAAKSIVSESVRNPGAYWENNVIGTRNLIDATIGAGTRRIVFSSTAAVYGDPVEEVLSETSRTSPVNAYGATKLAAEMMIANHCAAYGTSAVVLRYFNVAGAYREHGEMHIEETHLIPRILTASDGEFSVYGSDWPTFDGTCVRDYVHVADLADAHLLAAAVDVTGTVTVNLGSGHGYSVLEVLDEAERVTGRPVTRRYAPRRDGDPARLVTTNRLAAELLGWSPRLGLASMISDAWRFEQGRTS